MVPSYGDDFNASGAVGTGAANGAQGGASRATVGRLAHLRGDPGLVSGRALHTSRVEGRRSSVADYGTLRIDFSARRVCRGDEELTLTAYEYNTLAYLAHRAGEVISRSELLDHLYDHDHDRDGNVIEQFVARLRRKLDPEGSLTPIETVRGAGYRFTLDRASA